MLVTLAHQHSDKLTFFRLKILHMRSVVQTPPVSPMLLHYVCNLCIVYADAALMNLLIHCLNSMRRLAKHTYNILEEYSLESDTRYHQTFPDFQDLKLIIRINLI